MEILNADEELNIAIPVEIDGTGWSLTFNYPHNADDLTRALLSEKLKDTIHYTIQEIRTEAYEAGYKHGRGRKAKRRYHPGVFRITPQVYR